MAKLDRLTAQAAEHLEPGEPVLAAVTGTYETRVLGSNTTRQGALIATDRRIVFFGKKIGGYDLDSFAYGNVTSFEQGKNLMGHHVTIFAAGNRAHMKWIKTDGDLETFSTVVRSRLAGARPEEPEPGTAAPATPAQPDVIEQIRKLGELRGAGVLTQEEFDAKKAELLGRL